MPGSIRIGAIAGLDIYLHVSWFVVLTLLTLSLATSWFPQLYPGQGLPIYLLLGLVAAVLLFVSVLLHELAHSLVARRRGLPVKNITLFIFGGISNIEQEPEDAGTEFQMAFVGPLVSLLIGALAYLLLLPVRGTSSAVSAILSYLAASNILLGIFNLIPGFPLDGGRVLRSIIWRATGNPTRATRIATLVGQVIAYLFILLGVLLLFSGNIFDGIWVGFIGWFLLSSAQSVRSRSIIDHAFEGVTVEQVMNRQVATVPANISLQRLVDEYLIPQGWRSAFVVQGEQLAGLITLSDIRHTEREQWAQTPVGLVMIPLERLHMAAPGQQVKEVFAQLVQQDVNQLPVVDDGRLVGVINRDAILRSLQVRRSLGLDHAA